MATVSEHRWHNASDSEQLYAVPLWWETGSHCEASVLVSHTERMDDAEEVAMFGAMGLVVYNDDARPPDHTFFVTVPARWHAVVRHVGGVRLSVAPQ